MTMIDIFYVGSGYAALGIAGLRAMLALVSFDKDNISSKNGLFRILKV